jgi:hypothetical protein
VLRDLGGKRLGLLHDVVPGRKSIAFFIERELPDANRQIAAARRLRGRSASISWFSTQKPSESLRAPSRRP